MAVFTVVGLDHLQQWMQNYPSLGNASAIRGISSGIENSNYFIDTDKGEFVLTLFEVLKFDEAPFYLELMHHLAQHGIPVPAPVRNAEGGFCTELMGKPATIVSKLPGQSEMSPRPHHCARVGAMLARMHDAGASFPTHQNNLRGLAWWVKTMPTVSPFIDPSLQRLLSDEIKAQVEFAQSEIYQQLPTGPIHADLFRNNVMFYNDELSGFFDFYFAGWDKCLFDVAVTVNDWCIDIESGEFDLERLRAFLIAYNSVRPFTGSDDASWNLMLRAAAMRFWISRLYDFYLPREAEMLTPHDPGHFERILKLRKNFNLSLLHLAGK